MLFVNAGLRREPRITAARDHLVELLAAYAVPAPTRKARSASN